MAECLSKALRRCDLPDADAVRIAQELRIKSKEFLEKAYGRIESRLTTKKTGHPLLESRLTDCLFLDESGRAALDPKEPVFALGGVSMRENDIAAYVEEADRLKLHFFGRTDVTFHEPHMRKHINDFAFRGNAARQAEFDAAFRALVEATPFKVFGAGIHKEEFRHSFLDQATDHYLPKSVYDLAITLLLERYVDYLATDGERGVARHMGRVHLESIGKREDAEHQAAYTDLLLHGTQFVPEGTFQSWIEPGCRFSPKVRSNPSELADLVAREVFEWTRSDCKVDPPYWNVLNRKVYYRGDGHFGKFGVKVFPGMDLEDALLAHRTLCISLGTS